MNKIKEDFKKNLNTHSNILIGEDFEKMQRIIDERVLKNDKEDLDMLLDLMNENSEAMDILAKENY